MMTKISSPNGTPVSRFAFGAMQFGTTADEAASTEMFEACLTAGITHFDTAFAYTGGQSEEILGRLIAPHRDKLVLATKVGYTGGAMPSNLRAQFDTSRRRLGLDHIDILYLHRFDPEADLAETLAFFASLKQAGQISYVGLSNFAAWQVVKALWAAQALELPIATLQPMYSLIKRQAEVEILPMCTDMGLLPVTYSPLGAGLLSGKYSSNAANGRLTTDARYAARYGKGWMHHAAKELSNIAVDVNVHPATLAVAWAARHPSRPSPILSARNACQLAPSLDGILYEMNDETYARLSALTPTPAPATDRLEEA